MNTSKTSSPDFLPVSKQSHASGLIKTVERTVPQDWTDYNGHMNEGRYGQVFSDAASAILHRVGSGGAYIDSGSSFFTVENHIKYSKECLAGEAFYVLTKVVLAQGKKLKLRHHMFNAHDVLVCSDDQFLLHVDLNTRKSCLPSEAIAEKLAQLAQAHQAIA